MNVLKWSYEKLQVLLAKVRKDFEYEEYAWLYGNV
jgi:hypothetical protein